jgi:hypothetical protein
VRRTADGLVPLLVVAAIILLVILGAGAFKQPGYRGNTASASAEPPDAVNPVASPSPKRKAANDKKKPEKK